MRPACFADVPVSPRTSSTPVLLWFRQDLRLADNPALAAAPARGGAVVPVFVLDEAGEGRWAPGGASRWWLRRSLAALDAELRRRGSRLVFARGETGAELRRLAKATRADAVYWNDRYEPAVRARDAALKTTFEAEGLEARSFNGALLFSPDLVRNKRGGPFLVFTPFWRHCTGLRFPGPAGGDVSAIPAPARWPKGVGLEELGPARYIRRDAGPAKIWTPGEAGARARLGEFLKGGAIHAYDERRDSPGESGTSRLSPHLHWGEIGPRQVVAAVRALGKAAGLDPVSNGARVFLAGLGWREFAHHLLYHFPDTPERPLRAEFGRFPWAEDAEGRKLRAWREGRTGYPIVDAGMRELRATGWMHNRVRMIAASFLAKHLRLPWQAGAAWFWDTLVDADLADNTLGWQWTAGCGADAAPYFRVFSPVAQGERFDAAGRYVRAWVPELAKLPDNYIHSPWAAPGEALTEAGVRLGETYPRSMVDHAAARAEALAAFKTLRGGGTGDA
jgi:Deoxyribodipyrimidine photolyase